MKRLILASASEGRKKVLTQAGFGFSVYPSNFIEDLDSEADPYKLVSQLSAGKARAVAEKLRNAVIIGADTVVFCGGRIFGKPKTETEAKKILRFLSGKNHLMITGLTVIDCDSNKIITKTSVTKIFFRRLTAKEINEYAATNEPLTKAGGYAIQGRGAAFVDKVEGEYSGALGLPLELLKQILSRFEMTDTKIKKPKPGSSRLFQEEEYL